MWICTYIHNTFHNSHAKVFCEEKTNWHVVGHLLYLFIFGGLAGLLTLFSWVHWHPILKCFLPNIISSLL